MEQEDMDTWWQQLSITHRTWAQLLAPALGVTTTCRKGS